MNIRWLAIAIILAAMFLPASATKPVAAQGQTRSYDRVAAWQSPELEAIWLGHQANQEYQLLGLAAQSGNVDDNAILQWYTVLLEAISAEKLPPPFVARLLNAVGLAGFDALVPLNAGLNSVGVWWPGHEHYWPPHLRTDAARVETFSYAAYRVAVDIVPTQKARFDNLMAQLGFDPSNASEDVNEAAGIGNLVAKRHLEIRHADGSNGTSDYVPVNTVDKLVNPNHWQPLIGPDGQPQKPLYPGWGGVLGFVVNTEGNSVENFLLPTPPQYGSKRHKKETRKVVKYQQRPKDTRLAIAEYWANGPDDVTPPGHLVLLGQELARRYSLDIESTIRMFYALTSVLHDAAIVCWYNKFEHDTARPVTAIRCYYGHKTVKRLGQRIPGSEWTSYIPTPPFPSYPSGHSTFSGGAGHVLEWFFNGNDKIPGGSYRADILAGSFRFSDGPRRTVSLWFPYISAFAWGPNGSGISRLYGGIHYWADNWDGLVLGERVAKAVEAKAMAHALGTAPRWSGWPPGIKGPTAQHRNTVYAAVN